MGVAHQPPAGAHGQLRRLTGATARVMDGNGGAWAIMMKAGCLGGHKRGAGGEGRQLD